MSLSATVERAAAQAHHDPSEAQKEAGNYRKGHVTVHGINIAIENPKGGTRYGIGADGEPWSVTMPAHYGYIKGTTGKDGDHVDVYLGPHLKSPHVFVLHQHDADSGKFDEHKVLLGFGSKAQALNTYRKGFSDGRANERIGHVAEMTVDRFKDWLKTGDHTKQVKRASGGRIAMADGGGILSDSDLGLGAPAPSVMSDADVGIVAPEQQFKGVMGGLKEGVTNAPSEAWNLTKQRAADVYSNLNPFDEERRKNTVEGNTLDNWLKTGKGLLSAAGLPFAPIEGALRSIIGTPMAEAEHSVGTIIAPETAAKDDRQKMLEASKEDVATALSAAAPRRFAPAGPRPQVALPAPPQAPELGVPLSEGQRTGELPLIRREQAALRGQMGPQAEQAAKAFFGQQQQQVRTAAEQIADRLAGTSPRFDNISDAASVLNQEVGNTATAARAGLTAAERRAAVEESAARGMVQDQGDTLRDIIRAQGPEIAAPREAGEIAGEAIRRQAARDRAEYQRLYDEALGLEGQFHAGAFEGVGRRIQGQLSLGDNPVIIDDVTTPVASRAIRDLDGISSLQIQNRADPFGAPNTENIVALNLRGVDQARKRLVAFYRAARSSNNAADMRATGRLIDEFDNQIESAISNGLFSGDPRALEAIREGRAAYSRYQRQYRPQQAGDDVGAAMRRIIDRNATPEEIANMVIGSGRVGNSGLPVRLADRLETVLGPDSDAWSAIRQGIWQRASQIRNTAGEVDAARSANNILEFANSSLGRRAFSPDELTGMRNYARGLRDLDQTIASLPTTVAAERARGSYEQLFGGGDIGGPQASTFRRMVEGQATPEETAQAVFKAIGAGNPGNVSRMISAIDRVSGPEAMSAIRQGVWQKMTEAIGGADAPGAQKVTRAITEFLDGRGRTISETLFTQPERELIRQYADLQRRLVVPPTGANRSETSTFLAPILRKIGSNLGVVIGAVIGHSLSPGVPFVGEAVGAGTAKVAGSAANRLQARAVAKQFNQVQIATQQWQQAVARANRANSPQSEASLRLATANLARTLAAMGIDPASVGLTSQRNSSGQ